ncbi:porin [Vibrio europaeus]|uniref:Porin n=1 Tax=Vibrio europaeus TaxID=300876 RepID=A0AAE7AUR6_9VIBR|nr:porin [Vibrio europaeus]MDC5807500.1 porin [Vibrio europaeus]MDC5810781.1 porin [Vibrio europaeus]MDC5819683.1 porin [Vibrio europaeus]MDC5824700.1 porin [Vibrio europaeus]MDC5829122.1 porin [Vibrio europaeus]
MDKMFKRTLLGAAVAVASTGVMAKQVGVNSDFQVEAYGVAAISVVNYDTDETVISTGVVTDKSTGYDYENESRIGFRASKDMFDDLNVFVQIESGYVGENGDGATLGNRDTFLGLQGDWGKVRFGRMLTPMYEIIDWPYSNPGLGAAFDWGADVKYNRDRHGDMARFDSKDYNGFSFALATGRGESSVKDNYFYGANAHYKLADSFTIHAALESEQDRKISDSVAEAYSYCATPTGCKDADGSSVTQGSNYKSASAADQVNADTFGYILGFEASLPAGFGLAAAYKAGESKDTTGVKSEQASYSIIGQYWSGPWGFKLGYAANQESKKAGIKQDDADSIVSGQLMYVHNGFVPYVRVAQRDLKSDGKNSEIFVVRVGLEYGF